MQIENGQVEPEVGQIEKVEGDIGDLVGKHNALLKFSLNAESASTNLVILFTDTLLLVNNLW